MYSENTSLIYTGNQAKEIDHRAIALHGHSGFDLMREAGEKAFEILLKLQEASAAHEPLKVLVLCGTGNNGGDGYVIARCAIATGWNTTVISVDQAGTQDAQRAAREYANEAGTMHVYDSPAATQALNETYDVVVDALVGVGLNAALRSPVAELVSAANRLDAFKFAVDVPSGVNADTGQAYSPSFVADLTATFIVQKLGLLTGPALNFVGESVLLELAIDKQIIRQSDPIASKLDQPCLRARQSDSHKGSYGHCLIAGGDNGMLGATLLCGAAAMRSGSGKVTIMSNLEHLDKPALYRPELMSQVFSAGMHDPDQLTIWHAASAIAVGPGLGLGQWSRELFTLALSADRPSVIDADALTLLAAEPQGLPADTVLTPHPGEAARLLDCTAAEIQADRVTAARRIAKQYGAVCVLKGAGTVIADPYNDVYLCDRGNAGMATAGMGDVLSGIIVAFLGQGLNAMDAAKTGVWLHAAAADEWVIERASAALIASDIIEMLPTLLKRCTE